MAVGITKSAGEIFAPTQSNGAARRPSLADTQRWGVELERLVDATASNGPVFASVAAAAANLSWPVDTMAWIINETTPSENGIYRKLGGSGAGSWVRVGNLPYNDANVQAALDAAARAEAARIATEAIAIAAIGTISYSTRALIKALAAPIAGQTAILTENGREGVFVFRTGDFSSLVALDTREGLYLKANDTAATAGAWVREGWGKSTGLLPEWFGADGTVTNDHAAITAADALARSVGSFVLLQRRKYNTAAPLIVYDGSIWKGSGWTAGFNGSVGYVDGCVIQLAAGSNCNIIQQQASPSFRESFHLEGFAVNGDGANQTSLGTTQEAVTGIYQANRAGIKITDAYNARLVNVRAEDTRGTGIEVYGGTHGVTNLFLEGCSGYNNRVFNFYSGGNSTDIRFSGEGDWGFGRCGGLRLGTSCTVKGQTVWTSQCQDPADANTHINGTGAVGANQAGYILAGNNNKVSECRSEGHAGHGVKIANGTIGNEVSTNTIYATSFTASTSGLYDGINCGTSVVRPHIVGNMIKSALSGTRVNRYAINFESAPTSPTVLANSVRAIGPAGAVRTGTKSVDGLDPLTAITDWSWIETDIRANATSAVGYTTAATVAWTEVHDQDSEFASNTFTPTHDGEYIVEASLLGSVGATGTVVNLFVFDGTSEVVRLAQVVFSTASANGLVRGAVIVNLTGGTAYTIRCSATGGTFTNVVGSTFSYLSIKARR